MRDILGFGNAIVDLTGNAADIKDILIEQEHCKGGFFRTSEAEFSQLFCELKNYLANAGGSVCNSLKAMSVCGIKTAFYGKTGNDELAVVFRKDLAVYSVEDFVMIDKAQQTGCTLVLVSEDGEKIICGKMRAAKNVKVEDVDVSLIASSKMIFVEGYWLDHLRDVVDKIVDYASKQKVKIAFTLSDPKIVVEQKEALSKLLPKIDILFGNENEFLALGECKVALQVKTLGKEGVSVCQNGIWKDYLALKVDKIINTNGAGDAFAGGFLSAILQEKTIEMAVNIGQRCSQNVLEREMCAVSLNLKEL